MVRIERRRGTRMPTHHLGLVPTVRKMDGRICGELVLATCIMAVCVTMAKELPRASLISDLTAVPQRRLRSLRLQCVCQQIQRERARCFRLKIAKNRRLGAA